MTTSSFAPLALIFAAALLTGACQSGGDGAAASQPSGATATEEQVPDEAAAEEAAPAEEQAPAEAEGTGEAPAVAPEATWTPITEEAMTPEQAQQLALANTARQSLLDTLGGTLRSQMQQNGPVAAIPFCAEQAVPMADATAEAHSVRMGRTSHRLRNPNNTVPAWAEGFVAEVAAEPRYALSSEGTLGVFSPLPTGEPCVTCHGDTASMNPAVVAALGEAYPSDTATGFAVGDVRGWVWTEVDPR